MKYQRTKSDETRYHVILPGRMSSVCGKVAAQATDIDQLPPGAMLCGKCALCLRENRKE